MNWGTKMTDERKTDVGLDALFALARDGGDKAPSDALMSAILADADRVQADAFAATTAPAIPPKRAPLQKLLAALGGWPSVAGLAAATAAGVVRGVSPPEALDTLTASLLGSDLSDTDVLYGFDILLAEG